ncbi:hypothetical protein K492DRAFT_200265, partial [Lichtheimia hyalospora FSU 10163]
MTHCLPNDPCQQPTSQVSSEEHDSMVTMQHSIDTGTLASENNATGLTNSNAAHDAHGKQLALSLPTPRGVHDDKALQGTQENSDRRIDFIRQLPAEIVLTTLIPLFMYEGSLESSFPCPYLHVSKLWRDRIIQCLDGLQFWILLEEEHNDEKCSELVQFAQHTKSLSIDCYAEWVTDLLFVNNFCSLKEISIDEFSDKCRERFISSLASIDTLTHLSVRYGSISVADLVLACPHLESLHLDQPEHDPLDSLSMTPNPNMKKLSITYSSSEITSDHVIAICKTFPSLKELQLSPCTDIQSAFIVPEYFPSMQKLDVFLSNHGVEMAFLDQDEPCREQGITDLVIGGHLQDDNTGNDIVSLLQYYQGTL